MNYTNPENIYCHILRELGLSNKVSKNTACLLLSKIKIIIILKDDLFTKGKLPTTYRE